MIVSGGAKLLRRGMTLLLLLQEFLAESAEALEVGWVPHFGHRLGKARLNFQKVELGFYEYATELGFDI
jgi:hypothetical protein